MEERAGDGAGAERAGTNALTGAKLPTIGAISEFMKDADLNALDGVGESTAEEIEKSLEKFWQAHPEFTSSKTPADAPRA